MSRDVNRMNEPRALLRHHPQYPNCLMVDETQSIVELCLPARVGFLRVISDDPPILRVWFLFPLPRCLRFVYTTSSQRDRDVAAMRIAVREAREVMMIGRVPFKPTTDHSSQPDTVTPI
jgi:hypothetical protein